MTAQMNINFSFANLSLNPLQGKMHATSKRMLVNAWGSTCVTIMTPSIRNAIRSSGLAALGTATDSWTWLPATQRVKESQVSGHKC